MIIHSVVVFLYTIKFNSMKGLKTTKYVDTNTNEVQFETQEFYTKSEPAFFKSYVTDLGKFHSLSKGAISTLYEICKMMGYDNRIILIKSEKKIIADKVGVSLYAVDKAVKELYKTEFLLKTTTEKSKYVVNPNFFAKGVWKDIYKLKLSVIYENDQKYIVTEYEANTKN